MCARRRASNPDAQDYLIRNYELHIGGDRTRLRQEQPLGYRHREYQHSPALIRDTNQSGVLFGES